MELRRVLGAKKRWYARHPRVRLAVLIVVTAGFLLDAALRLASRDGHWLLLSSVYLVGGLAFADEAWQVAVQLRRRTAADGRQVDDEADEAGGFGDGVGEVDGAEGHVG